MAGDGAVRGSPAEVDPALVLDGAHPHGYLLLSAVVPPPADVSGWRSRRDLIPGTTLYLHPRTVLSYGRGATGTVVLLGHPVDVGAGVTDGHRIASRLAGTWDLRGDDALVRQAADLGGRWSLLAASARHEKNLVHGSDLLVVPDTHATQPVFHALYAGHIALGSTPALVAAALDLPVDGRALALLAQLRERRKGAVTYLPGRLTPYVGLDPLLPNILLRVELGERPTLRRERFWPWQERVETDDIGAVHAAFRERLTAHTTLLAGLGRPAVSLTAGTDSRVTAAAARKALHERGGFAFTYVNPRDARAKPAAMADVTGASAVAGQLGVPHRVLRWRQPPPGGTFDVLHRRTYAPLVPSRGAAHAMWADLPADLVQLQSNCAETGTTFLRDRTDEPLSPLRLARMMMHATEGLEDLADRMYGGYVEHARMTPERLMGYDHHDVFYWEQRIGRWGWQKFVDGDFGHRILLPFNDRVLLETMLSLPYPLREAKILLDRILDDEPRARLPRRTEPTGRPLARSAAERLPGPFARRTLAAARQEHRRRDQARFSWPRGYAMLPHGAGRAGAPVVREPRGWSRVVLPGGSAELRHDPRLPRALTGTADTWVLVLGDPVDVDVGLLGARRVAQPLHRLLRQDPDRAAATTSAWAGSWLAVLRSPGRTVVLTDPMVSLGLHLLDDGRGLVSHATLAAGVVTGQLDGSSAVSGTESLGAGPLETVAVGNLAQPDSSIDLDEARRARLARHVDLLLRRGPAWLGLDDGQPSAELLDLLAGRPQVGAVTWWDRLGGDRAADLAIGANRAAVVSGLAHRLIGLHEDVDGSAGGPGRVTREAAREAWRRTWGKDDLPPPVGDALDQTLPRNAIVWLGATPNDSCGRPRCWDLVQGVRPVALPFSDRLLRHLP